MTSRAGSYQAGPFPTPEPGMKCCRTSRLVLCLLLLPGVAPLAQAFVVPIAPGAPASVYLRVGDGAPWKDPYDVGGKPKSGGLVNLVSVEVPAAVLGNGIHRVMASNSQQFHSDYDGRTFCTQGQVYIGGFYRIKDVSSGSTQLTVTAPLNLVNDNGDTIPFSQISWTSSDSAEPFQAVSFSGGGQTLGNFPVNTWRESCHTFYYKNDAVVAPGIYTGTVTYTMTLP